MNKTILSVSIMAGITVMLSMSVIPANATSPDNVCVGTEQKGLKCANDLAVGQHVLLNLEPIKEIRENASTAGCHYNVNETAVFGVEYWLFFLDDGPKNCENFFAIVKSFVF